MLALGLKRTVYDTLYLAVALAGDRSYVTADERLVNGLAHSDLSRASTGGAWQLTSRRVA